MPHGKVLILCGDDNPQNDIRPRLDVMRADQSCVGMIDLRDSADGTPRPFDLANLCDLRDALDKDDAINFVIIDPISAFVGKRDANKHSDVYALIAPLNQLAAEYGVAVVIVAHTNKGGKGANDYRSRINGSGAWSDATRSGFMFVKDRSDDDRRYITHGKINAAKIGKGIAFRVVEVPHEIGSAIRIEWEAEVDMTADQALQQAADNDGAKLTEAVDFLGEYHGEVANNVLFADAERRGIKLDTLYRAKAKLKIVARRDGFGREAVYYWDCGATATEIDRKTADDERSF